MKKTRNKSSLFRLKRPLKIIVTAGPTIEHIDPVRFISNHSSGLMGYKIAEESARRGHKAILISGPAGLVPPKNVKTIQIETAVEMFRQVQRFFKNSDCLIMASAVSDFRPRYSSCKKIKRAGRKKITLELVQNPDILLEVSKGKKNRVLAGFALETNDLLKNAKKKLAKKNLDIIIANKLDKAGSPFGAGKKDFYLIDKHGITKKMSGISKSKLAELLLDKIEKLCYT